MLKVILGVLLGAIVVVMPMQGGEVNYLYDRNGVRYELYQTNAGRPFNWLLFPGGAGVDSSYLRSLVDVLNLPGNVWLIDFPGNGDNISANFSGNFDEWFSIFPQIIRRFDNPVIVGHSFGGMFPLLFPELEKMVRGCAILNSAPKMWHQEAVVYAKQFDLPDFNVEIQAFMQHPNQQTFQAALGACMPYYFPKKTLESGKQWLLSIPFPYLPALWWQETVMESNFSATWIPQSVPTLIIGGKYDCMCPFSLFQKDARFQRPNIELCFIEDAGHISWRDNPAAVRGAFDRLIALLDAKDTLHE